MNAEKQTYQHRVIQDPEIMVGKPVIKGTRIPVERIIAHLAQTPDLVDLFAAYPELTEDDVKASLEYAYAAMTKKRGRKETSTARPSASV